MKLNLMKYFLQRIFPTANNENITVRVIVCAIPRARVRRSHLLCDFVAGSVMSIRNYFRPSNRLSEPMGCKSVALKVESGEL